VSLVRAQVGQPNVPVAQLAERCAPNAKVVGSIPTRFAKFAALAQLVEQLPCKQLVEGSIPSGGTNTEPGDSPGPSSQRYG